MKITSKEHEKLVKFIIHNIQGVSFSYVQKALRKGDIKVNGKRTKENIDVFPNDEIDIYIPQKSKQICAMRCGEILVCPILMNRVPRLES